MSAKIIEFPKSDKQLELEAMKDFVGKAKTIIMQSMTEDIHSYSGANVNGIPVEEPKTGEEYLALVKFFLESEDYYDILCGIMDKQIYDTLERPLQKIIEAYFSFKQ